MKGFEKVCQGSMRCIIDMYWRLEMEDDDFLLDDLFEKIMLEAAEDYDV